MHLATATPQVHGSVYDHSLKPTEFRVACVPGSLDQDEPVHLTLQTYPDDNYPEFEAVS